jgi:hypothetical protein
MKNGREKVCRGRDDLSVKNQAVAVNNNLCVCQSSLATVPYLRAILLQRVKVMPS